MSSALDKPLDLLSPELEHLTSLEESGHDDDEVISTPHPLEDKTPTDDREQNHKFADQLIISELEENRKNVNNRSGRQPRAKSRLSSKSPEAMRDLSKLSGQAGKRRPVGRPPTEKRSLYTGRLNPSFSTKDWDSSINDMFYQELNFLPALPESSDIIAADVAGRMLKAKVDVLQDELQRMIHECLEKEDRIRLLDGKLKEYEHEKLRFQRELSMKQQQLDKGQKLVDEARSKADSMELQCVGLKKELEILRSGQKQVVVTKGSTESRLNRTLEELERCKVELKQARMSSKELNEMDKKRLEELSAENKHLEKQKSELLMAFKKQLKLIDILKKQKMHMEVAKVLQFTEEEFMKALDWGS